MRLNWILRIVLLGLVAASMVSCGGIETASVDPLDGTSWLLTAIEGRDPLPGTTITALFEDGTIHGSSGCNNYGASYKTDADQIEISEIESTLMGCTEPEGAMDQEQMVTKLLGDSEAFLIANGQLRLLISGKEALAFVARN